MGSAALTSSLANRRTKVAGTLRVPFVLFLRPRRAERARYFSGQEFSNVHKGFQR